MRWVFHQSHGRIYAVSVYARKDALPEYMTLEEFRAFKRGS
jgi:hypothetical protein